MANTNLFYQGRPCNHGHSGLRYTSCNLCVECSRNRASERQHNGYHSPCQSDPLYRRWRMIKERCYRRAHMAYKNYGGRGITMCERWRDFATFAADIMAEIGPPPSPKHTLDRIDNNGNYEPGNLRWATRTTQGRNNRWVKLTLNDARLIRQLYIGGYWGNTAELAARFSVSPDTIRKIASGERWREE